MSSNVITNINKSIKTMEKTTDLVEKIEKKLKESIKDTNNKVRIEFSPTIKIEIKQNDLVKSTVRKKPGPKKTTKKGSKSKKSDKSKKSKILGLF